MAIPVSTIATSASTRSSMPLIFAAEESRPSMRLIPFGTCWAESSIFSSGTTASTAGSSRSALTCLGLRRAVRPRMAWLNVRSALKPTFFAWRAWRPRRPCRCGRRRSSGPSGRQRPTPAAGGVGWGASVGAGRGHRLGGGRLFRREGRVRRWRWLGRCVGRGSHLRRGRRLRRQGAGIRGRGRPGEREEQGGGHERGDVAAHVQAPGSMRLGRRRGGRGRDGTLRSTVKPRGKSCAEVGPGGPGSAMAHQSRPHRTGSDRPASRTPIARGGSPPRPRRCGRGSPRGADPGMPGRLPCSWRST